MPSDTAADRLLDVRGLRCPVPILMTARVVAGLERGERLSVIGDDPGMLVDLPAWCAESGHRLLEIGEADGLVRCLLEVTGEPPLP